ncbi:SRPBCC family protein [Actinoplanes sp. NEAU-A11]|uniref:SRPBCC family protein n=2 Tax=Actinoplanes aureus TaxID=2792083 RepID=A0A931CGM8_9ACTN|nr:SRPBCC family protein [Actinoplanes aureus]
MVQQAIEVSAPVHTVYEQLAAFENYPRFMTGVRQVTSVGADQTHWIMDVDGKRREFDAQIIERSPDERVSWSTMEGPLLAETITLRPMGETKTQVVAQLEADIAFLMPSDRHGQESLNRRLKADLTTFKGLVESGVLGGRPMPTGASTKLFGGVLSRDPVSPASVAARIRNRQSTPPPGPGAGWDTGTADLGNADPTGTGLTDNPIHNAPTIADIKSPSGIRGPQNIEREMRSAGRRVGAPGALSGGVSGTAPMGGRISNTDMWGDGMVNEEERG